MKMLDLIAKEYGWRDDYILSIRPYKRVTQVANIILQRKEKEEYEHWYKFAFLASVIANCTPRKSRKIFKPDDFIKKPSQRAGTEIDFCLEEAKRLGLRTPKFLSRRIF